MTKKWKIRKAYNGEVDKCKTSYIITKAGDDRHKLLYINIHIDGTSTYRQVYAWPQGTWADKINTKEDIIRWVAKWLVYNGYA